MSVSERKFGALPTGEEVKIYHLENKKGAYAEVLQYGAILVKICVPDKNGDLKDVVLGYDDIRGYEINGCFFGAIKLNDQIDQLDIFLHLTLRLRHMAWIPLYVHNSPHLSIL